jgi:hypothetical protein
MEFPAYVPAAVREYVTKLIEGNSGWQEGLVQIEGLLAEIDETIQSYIRCGRDDDLPGLRKERAEAVALRNRLKANVDCFRRLVQDERMREAYAILTHEFTNDRQWRSFIHAARAARVDFSKYRERLKRAAELADKIAKTAKTLAALIRQFSETGIKGPSEFYSIPVLLRKTDSYEMDGHNLHTWRSMRRYILGDPPRWDVRGTMSAEEGGEPMSPIEIFDAMLDDLFGPSELDVQDEKPADECGETMAPIDIVRAPIGKKPEIPPEEKVRYVLSYAWGAAPDFSALLETVASAARSFKPSLPDAIGAAVKLRQHNPKTEYLRAFGKLLTVQGFALTTPIMKAMAITATVVINRPDVDVTYDDVRKALQRLGV